MDKREEIRERWLRKVQGRKGRAVAQRGKEAAAAQRQVSSPPTEQFCILTLQSNIAVYTLVKRLLRTSRICL